MKAWKAAVLLAVAVAVSGCASLTSGGEEETTFQYTQTDGLTMKFSPSSNSFKESEKLSFQVSLENTGESEATGIDVRLFGSQPVRDSRPVSVPATSLSPVDVSAQQPGGSTTGLWKGNPVDLEGGVTEQFLSGAEVSYSYSTTARASFDVVPAEEFEGGAEPVSTDNTAGPVQVQVDVSSPKPLYGKARPTITVPLKVRNVGNGEVDGKVSLDVSVPGGGTKVSVTQCNPSSPELFDGSREVLCTIELPEPSDQFQLERTVRLEVNMDYTYVETVEKQFTVEGMPGNRVPE